MNKRSRPALVRQLLLLLLTTPATTAEAYDVEGLLSSGQITFELDSGELNQDT